MSNSNGPAERLIAFSDAVVAIAITLLAIDLPVPTGGTWATFRTAVGNDWDHYLAFLISFAVIAAAWRQHHDVFRYITRSDPRMVSYDLVWMLTIVLNPFATKLLTTNDGEDQRTHAVLFGFYALLEVIAYVAFVAMIRHSAAHGLVAADTPPRVMAEARTVCYGVILGFGLSIPLFFVTRDAWVLWILGSVVVGRTAAWRARRRRHH